MKAVLAAGFRAREGYHEMLVMQLRFDRLVRPLRVLLADSRAPANPGKAGCGPGARLKCDPRRLGAEPKGRDGAPAGTRARLGLSASPGGTGGRREPGRDLGFYTL
jgi:hypothetical protein